MISGSVTTGPTMRVYYQDAYVTTLNVTGGTVIQDQSGCYALFNQTIFHPQGGGQPADRGYFIAAGQKWTITKLEENGSQIRHYFDPGTATPTFTDAQLCIDAEYRMTLARIHSAGHLMEDAIAALGIPLDGIKGYHFPEGPSVTFKIRDGVSAFDFTAQKKAIEDKVNEFVSQCIPLCVTYDSSGVRYVQFQGLNPLGCGGTHVRHSGEVGVFSIRKIEKKPGEIKIGYKVQ